MSLKKVYLNRRRDSRHLAQHDPITWKTDERCPRHPGLIHDVSMSGLSFLTDKTYGLKVGDGVELARRRSAGDQLCCRVVRIRRQADGRVRVGCKRIHSLEVVTISDPSPEKGALRYVVRPRPTIRPAA
jgi:hypothetical protein